MPLVTTAHRVANLLADLRKIHAPTLIQLDRKIVNVNFIAGSNLDLSARLGKSFLKNILFLASYVSTAWFLWLPDAEICHHTIVSLKNISIISKCYFKYIAYTEV